MLLHVVLKYAKNEHEVLKYFYNIYRDHHKKVSSLRSSEGSLTVGVVIQGVQLKSGQYFNMSNLFTKIYNMLYYTTNLSLQ